MQETSLRLLLITPFLPHRDVGHGTATIVSQYVRYLAARHELGVVCFTWSPREEALAASLAESCAFVRTVPFRPAWARRQRARLESLATGTPLMVALHSDRRMRRELQRVFASRPFDLVQIDSTQMGQYAGLIPEGTRRVLLEIDVAMKPLRRRMERAVSWPRRLHYRREWRNMCRYEVDLCGRFDRVYTVTEDDARLLRAKAPHLSPAVVGVGADPGLFDVPRKSPAERVIVFVGAFMHPPNVDGILWFHESIFPRIRSRVAGVQLWLVGADPPPAVAALANDPDVRVCGGAPGPRAGSDARHPDIATYLRAADVCVVPIRLGGGIKMKTVEAAAAGRAIVTTQVGAEGLALRHGEDALIADDAAAFADEVVRALQDDGLRERLGRGAREVASRDHRWDVNLARVESDFATLAGRHGDSAAAPADAAPVDVSIVIATYNTEGLLGRCLQALTGAPPRRSHEIVVVDDASRDGTAAMVRERFPAVRLLRNERNVGYARSVNRAIAATRGRFVYLLNSDAAPQPGAVDALADFLDARPEAGAAGSVLYGEDGILQAAAKAEPSFRSALFGKRSLLSRWLPRLGAVRDELLHWKAVGQEPFEVGYISSASLMVPREVIDSVGMLDDRFWHFIDADYCKRVARSGRAVFCVPAAKAIHREHCGGTLCDARHRLRSVWTFHYGAYLYFRKHSGTPRWHPLHGVVALALGARYATVLLLQGVREAVGSDARRYGAEREIA